MIKSILIAAVTLAAVTPAAIADTSEPVEATIPFTSEELTSEKGRTALQNRIERAAKLACTVDQADSHIPQVDQSCVAEIIAKAEAALEDERVALNKERGVALSKLITAGQPSFR